MGITCLCSSRKEKVPFLRTLRSVVYRFDDRSQFQRTLGRDDQELNLPPGESVADGEWVLAIFELGKGRRATAAAARGLDRGGSLGFGLAFERRDWERLRAFVPESAPGPPGPPEPPEEDAPATTRSMPPPHDEPPHGERSPPSTGDTQRMSRSPAPPSAAYSASYSVRAHVLVVDDDATVRDMVVAMLEAVGLTVATAENAEDALARLGKEGYDLLVLDWNLPKMNGVEMCKEIRRRRDVAHLPILMLTGHAASKDVVLAFAAGADDYVTKPFRAPELGARIFSLLRRSRRSL
jgi:two-component system, OmpR family, phosphate regulon response regulator PhoB